MADKDQDEMSIPWGLHVTRSTMKVLAEVTAKVGDNTVWPFPPIPDDKREAYIIEIAALVATVAMSDARRTRAKSL